MGCNGVSEGYGKRLSGAQPARIGPAKRGQRQGFVSLKTESFSPF
jgi:hypothetical protein